MHRYRSSSRAVAAGQGSVPVCLSISKLSTNVWVVQSHLKSRGSVHGLPPS